jgi:hypothetical protein
MPFEEQFFSNPPISRAGIKGLKVDHSFAAVVTFASCDINIGRT